MENIIVFIMFLIGLIIIIKGGDLFIETVVWIAAITGIPTIIIGATIVSLATTLPELFVSTMAAAKGHPEMAIGNAIGSIICNTGFILGLSACISPIHIRRRFFTIKGSMMVFSLICFYILSHDKCVARTEGFILIFLLIIYIIINVFEFRDSKHTLHHFHYDKNNKDYSIWMIILRFFAGAGAIILGARLLVENGIQIAKIFNIPEQIISLTLIALGTSLPEFVTSLTAIIKGHKGISIGNIIGANILNVTMVLGTSSIVPEHGLKVLTEDICLFNQVWVDVSQTLLLDIPVALLMTVILLIIGTFKKVITRKSGFVLLLLYVGYLSLLSKISF
jgi:cation:H+ antiporter